jgi:hypothetical protein
MQRTTPHQALKKILNLDAFKLHLRYFIALWIPSQLHGSF